MANRRCVNSLIGYTRAIFFSYSAFKSLETPIHLPILPLSDSPQNLTSKFYQIQLNVQPNYSSNFCRHFSSGRNDSGNEYDNDEEVEEEDDGETSDEEADAGAVSLSNQKRVYSLEEKEKEAADIGYRVIGPLEPSDRPFKPFEPAFAVIQIGSHQFKVSNGDCIYTERLKFCEVNDKLVLNRVLMLGSATQTIIGRPILPDAAVHAVVEEHALDAKVIIFKKKRRKNYRRTRGHRQELTRLRITDIQGIEKPGNVGASKPVKEAVKKPVNVAVAA